MTNKKILEYILGQLLVSLLLVVLTEGKIQVIAAAMALVYLILFTVIGCTTILLEALSPKEVKL